jgi:hypothetical protein
MAARALAVAAMLLATPAAFAASPNDPFSCPRGQLSQMTVGEFEAQAAPYRTGALDPLPRGRVEKPLPKVYFVREDLEDPTFPSRGRANAVLLVRENGTVASVLVPCTSSIKLVDNIVRSLSKAQLDPAMQRGVPVKSMVVVPVAFGD